FENAGVYILGGSDAALREAIAWFREPYVAGKTALILPEGLSKTVSAPPVILAVSPYEGYRYVGEHTPVFAAQIHSGAGVDAVNFTLDGSELAVRFDEAEQTARGFVADEVPNGEHSLTVTVTDRNGATATVTRRFTVSDDLEYRLLRGEIHSHTEESDGKGTLEEAYAYARDEAHFDFFSVTDHSHWTWEYYLGRQIAVADSFDEPGRFTALYGFEVTWGDNGWYGHYNAIMPSDMYLASEMTLKQFYDRFISDPTAVGMFNHSNNEHGDFEQFAYRTLAINQKTCLYEFQDINFIEEYYIKALSRGWHLGTTYDEDNHQKQWGNVSPKHTVVLAESHDRTGVLEALRAGRSYATNDNTLEIDYRVNGHLLGSTVYNADRLVATVRAETTRANGIGVMELIGDNGLVLASKNFGGAKEIEWSVELPEGVTFAYLRSNNKGLWLITGGIFFERNETLALSGAEIMSSGTANEYGFAVDVVNPTGQTVTDAKIVYYVGGALDTETAVATQALGELAPGASVRAENWFTVDPGTKKNHVIAVVTGKIGTTAVSASYGTYVSGVYITELMPSSPSYKGIADAFVFIEVYNNDTDALDLNRLALRLRYKQGIKDAALPMWKAAGTLAPHTVGVIWLRKSGNTLTVADFNEHFGTSLVENETIFLVETDTLMPTTVRPSFMVTAMRSALYYQQTRITWGDLIGTRTFGPDQTLTFGYAPDGNTFTAIPLETFAAPTPGTVSDGQVPRVAR
ncbi:MAG: hypothetical protein KIG36_04080, partial [Eubacteriales bacterium]|nr:hypothetical protein [Eubacteriales bacterium]